MSRLGWLLEEAHRVENRAGYHLTGAVVQRRASRRVLALVARQFRRAADLLDEAAALLPETSPRGTDTSD